MAALMWDAVKVMVGEGVGVWEWGVTEGALMQAPEQFAASGI